MARLVRSIIKGMPSYSAFDAYYMSVIRRGVAGAPTADEARRDLERRQATFVYLGGL